VSRTACNNSVVITETVASHNGLSSWGRVKMTW
jgi:hypothetical protein